jgi:chemotaxis family two-component system response regulator Rcp1
MSFKVLYIDDAVEDRTLLTEILAQIAPDIQLEVAENGESGLAKLAGAYRPNLVLLDLNMPGMDGFEVLKLIKGDPGLKSLPVIVFSVTTASLHINQAFEIGANAVINKPLTLEEYKSVFVDTFRFWREITRLPETE